jgi:hypothetical protein
MVPVKEGTAITGEEKIRDKISGLYSGVVFYDGRPTESQLEFVKTLRFEIDQAKLKLMNTRKAYSKRVKQLLPDNLKGYVTE